MHNQTVGSASPRKFPPKGPKVFADLCHCCKPPCPHPQYQPVWTVSAIGGFGQLYSYHVVASPTLGHSEMSCVQFVVAVDTLRLWMQSTRRRFSRSRQRLTVDFCRASRASIRQDRHSCSFMRQRIFNHCPALWIFFCGRSVKKNSPYGPLGLFRRHLTGTTCVWPPIIIFNLVCSWRRVSPHMQCIVERLVCTYKAGSMWRTMDMFVRMSPASVYLHDLMLRPLPKAVLLGS